MMNDHKMPADEALNTPTYAQTYQSADMDPQAFWLNAAGAGWWDQPPKVAFAESGGPIGTWFPDGTTNMCAAALDQHVDAGRGDQAAIIYESAYDGTTSVLSYAETRERVARLAAGLRDLGVGFGDRVVIYMPMIPDAVVAMLACARIGAPHSVVFGGFAAAELASRIDDCRPTAIIAGSCGMEPGRILPYGPILDKALAAAQFPPSILVMKQRAACPAELLVGRDHDFDDLVTASRPIPPVVVPSAHPLYILYTSGTTGDPKGLMRDTGGYMTALLWSMRHIYGARAGEVFWAASDIGWVVGHSYIVYGPLLAGCTTLLYEGKPVGTPDAGTYWRLAEKHRVVTLFTAPTALRAIKREDPNGLCMGCADLSLLRTLFLAGERADPDTVRWARAVLGRPVIDHWWQTELGWPAIAAFPGLGDLATRDGSAGRPVPGFSFSIVDEDGCDVKDGSEGTLLIDLPLPPGCSPTLWGADNRYRDVYLVGNPGRFATGDAGMRDEDGFLYVMGRIDDIINVAGHRLSTGAIEEVLSEDADIAECAVVGAADALKGQIPVGLVVLKAGRTLDQPALAKRLVAAVRARLGPVVAFKRVVIVSRLPKTRSGKVLRRVLRAIADQRPYTVPPTIDDATAIEEIVAMFAQEVI
jgi:propionyl-CoA synthetase